MSNTSLIWRLFSREELSDALFGNQLLYRKEIPHLEDGCFGLDSIAVAYPVDGRDRVYSPPGLIVLDEESRPEILSWLRVNSPEIFPISQFGRVLTSRDWFDIYEPYFSRRLFGEFGREDRWASIIAGEIIAQGDVDVELDSLPLSRAAGCFSTALARTNLTYGALDVSTICVQRLKRLELDSRFVRRHVSVEDLVPVWWIAEKAGTDVFDHEGAIGLIFDVLNEKDRLNSLYKYFFNAKQLHSDSIEERVVAFNELVETLKALPPNIRRSATCSAVLAVSAFLVGRSTSHEFLVRRNLEAFPFGPIWFGLFAGLLGSSYWGMTWARAAKGVERQLRSKFRWEESFGFDICWAEYVWYASTFEDSTFSAFPKLAQRVISVEVVPGASCQFRMSAGHSTVAAVAKENILTVEPAKAATGEALAILSQFIKLAAKAEALTRAESVQVSMFPKAATATRSRAKKPKGST